jgi:hypothetical protein
MKPARGILVPVLALLALGGILATFAATPAKSEPAATTPAATVPHPAAAVPAPAAAPSASEPKCGQGQATLADPGFSSENEAVPVAGDNCPCYNYNDCVLCCEAEYSNFMCHTQEDKHHHPIYPGVCFCWN